MRDDDGFVQFKRPPTIIDMGANPPQGILIRGVPDLPMEGRWGFASWKVAGVGSRTLRICGHCGMKWIFSVLGRGPAVPEYWVCRACNHSNVEGADG